MPALRAEMRSEAERLGIHLLDNRSVELGGIKFIGTTLWTDFALYADDPDYEADMTYERALAVVPDFSLIEQPDGTAFTPQESQRLHREAISWLERELSTPICGPKVVITHHAPLADCIPTRYRGDSLSPVFASRLHQFMGKAVLWVHGHVHEPVDLVCQGTRVIANPGGYPDEFEDTLFCFRPGGGGDGSCAGIAVAVSGQDKHYLCVLFNRLARVRVWVAAIQFPLLLPRIAFGIIDGRALSFL